LLINHLYAIKYASLWLLAIAVVSCSFVDP
jgi:hypothetical protein